MFLEIMGLYVERRFAGDREDDGLNPKAVEAVDTARMRAAVVLNFIGSRRRGDREKERQMLFVFTLANFISRLTYVQAMDT